VRVCSVYVPNGRSLEDDHYRYKLTWLSRLRTVLEHRHSPEELLVILGDWNVTPDDIDVWDPAAFQGGTHVSAPEREAIAALREWGLVDTLRERYPEPGIYSYWDYRNGDFHKKRGIRIDYLLSTPALARQCRADLIDRNARKGTKPSDHAPVLAEFDL
jgi:exodeoxyribonuclease-3